MEQNSDLFLRETVVSIQTPAEFMRLLRGVHARSGVTAGQISARTGLPRSTAYRFASPTNNALPKRRENVQAFLRGCLVHPVGIDTVLMVWDRLNGHPARTANTRPERSPHPSWSAAGHRPVKVTDRVPAGLGDDAAELPPGENGALVVEPIVTTSPPSPQLPGRAARRRSRRRAAFAPWMVWLGAVSSFFIAVYPVTTWIWFAKSYTAGGHASTFLTTALMMLIATSVWMRSAAYRTNAMSRTGVTASAVGGTAGAVLAWAATGHPLVMLLSGLSLSSIAPVWVMTTAPVDVRSARGLFIAMTAAWFSTALGYLAHSMGIPTSGAILVGFAAAVTSTMILSSKLINPCPLHTSVRLPGDKATAVRTECAQMRDVCRWATS